MVCRDEEGTTIETSVQTKGVDFQATARTIYDPTLVGCNAIGGQAISMPGSVGRNHSVNLLV